MLITLGYITMQFHINLHTTLQNQLKMKPLLNFYESSPSISFEMIQAQGQEVLISLSMIVYVEDDL